MTEMCKKKTLNALWFTWSQCDLKPVGHESGIRQDDSSVEFGAALAHVAQGLSVFTTTEKTRGKRQNNKSSC